MTSKELLYVEDALGHEEHMKICSKETSTKLSDPLLANYMEQLEKTHTDLYNKFLNLL